MTTTQKASILLDHTLDKYKMHNTVPKEYVINLLLAFKGDTSFLNSIQK